MAEDWMVSFAAALAALPPLPAEQYVEPFRHGTMLTGLYAPRGGDPQKPHRQDEIYVVMRGQGVFSREDEKRPFGPGDMIFVPAGMPHRFEDFSDDFAAWVFFWGPKGGK